MWYRSSDRISFFFKIAPREGRLDPSPCLIGGARRRPFPQMEGTEPSCPAQQPSSSPPLSRVRSARFGVSSGRPSHDDDDDDAERDPSTSAPAAKRRKNNALDLSDVPINMAPIPSDKPGSISRFKGVYKNKKKWGARIRVPSEGGEVKLGTFDSEEEAGIMFARARYKYPIKRP